MIQNDNLQMCAKVKTIVTIINAQSKKPNERTPHEILLTQMIWKNFKPRRE